MNVTQLYGSNWCCGVRGAGSVLDYSTYRYSTADKLTVKRGTHGPKYSQEKDMVKIEIGIQMLQTFRVEEE